MKKQFFKKMLALILAFSVFVSVSPSVIQAGMLESSNTEQDDSSGSNNEGDFGGSDNKGDTSENNDSNVDEKSDDDEDENNDSNVDEKSDDDEDENNDSNVDEKSDDDEDENNDGITDEELNDGIIEEELIEEELIEEELIEEELIEEMIEEISLEYNLVKATIYSGVNKDGTYNPSDIIYDDEQRIYVEGLLPVDSVIKAYRVESLDEEHRNEIEDLGEEIVFAYDITIFIYDEQTGGYSKKWQPTEPVVVTFETKELSEYVDVSVYHIAEEYALETVVESKQAPEAVEDLETFEANFFAMPTAVIFSDEVINTYVETVDVVENTDYSVAFMAESFSIYAVTVKGDKNIEISYTVNGETKKVVFLNRLATVFVDKNDDIELEFVSASYKIEYNGEEKELENDNKFSFNMGDTKVTHTIKINHVNHPLNVYTIQFVYAAKELTTVNTVNNSQAGIKMWMTDHSSGGGGHKFGKNTGGNTLITQGLVQNKLGSDGFPVNANSSNESLKDLFGGSNSKVADYLFQYDSITNNYFYDSAENFAAFDKNSGEFTVYNQLGTTRKNANDNPAFYARGQFMPYNTLNLKSIIHNNLYSHTSKLLPQDHPRYNEPLYALGGALNYYFGMQMEAKFYQPNSGLLPDGSDMIFEFTGDDDLWVFIDGNLVLDIGGTHGALSGDINFRTGEIREEMSAGSLNITSTIKERYERADASTAEFAGNTFADFSGHEIKVFYMERGAGASTLKINFNIPTLPEGSVSIAKKVENISSGILPTNDYEMSLYIKKNGESDFALQNDVSYKVGNTEYKTDADTGIFKLKNGENAIFEGFQDGDKYYVVESGLDPDNYAGIEFEMKVGDTDTSSVAGEKLDEYKFKSPDYSYNYSDANTVTLTVKNTVSVDQIVDIEVNKAFEHVDGTTTVNAPSDYDATFTIYRLVKDANDPNKLVRDINFKETVQYKEFVDGKYTFKVPVAFEAVYEIEEEIISPDKIDELIYKRTTVKVGENGTVENGVGTTCSESIEVKASTTSTTELPNVYFVNYFGPESGDFIVNKVDDKGEALKGAGFTLQKFADNEWKAVGAEKKSDVLGVVSFNSLAVDTRYRISETKVPENYKGYSDYIYFKITEAGEIVFTNANGANISDIAVKGVEILTSQQGNVVLGIKVTNSKAIYGIRVVKINEYEKAVIGAGFVVYKNVSNVPNYAVKAIDGTVTYTTVKADATIFTTALKDSKAQFELFGLEEGVYYIEETIVPSGYNPLSGPIKITIDADEVDVAGYAEIEVINYTGITLPDTGGIGTGIFKIVGFTMILGAIALLAIRRKNKTAKID